MKHAPLFLAALVAAAALTFAATVPLPSPLPDPKLTPGAVLPVTAKDLCVAGYAKKVRNVTAEEKAAIYKEYGIAPNQRHLVEVDHLCPLECGGSNLPSNLWCERWYLNVGGLEEGAHEKDKAENAVHAAICGGQISLADAQKGFETDWRALYLKYVGPFPKAKHP